MSRLSTVVLASVLMISATREVRAQGDWAPSDTVITMVRDGCERRCPVYRVIIFASGTVVVQGQFYLRSPVLAKSEIPAASVLRLVERFKAVDYFHLADDFGYKGKGCASAGNSDGPNVITTIVTSGHGKSIVHHHGCLGTIPDQLTALEDEIDQTAGTAKWFKPALRRSVR